MNDADHAASRTCHRDHVIALWPMRFRRGWSQGACSCGEHVESHVPGVVEVWARWHGVAVGEAAPVVDFRPETC
jgi:hypothetical protein